MTSASDRVAEAFLSSLESAEHKPKPYPHWFLKNCVPPETIDEINALPLAAPEIGGISGKRELHNATRNYFDRDNQARFPVARAVAEAFQMQSVTDRIASYFGANLSGTYLRIEYAQDTDGFWLEPHTDLGVKQFTMLLYCSREPSHRDLGTDIYDSEKRHVGRSPFEPGGALVFIPADDTYHGFEPRPI